MTADQMVLKTLSRRIRVTQDGKSRYMTINEAILTKMAARALQGEVTAAKFLIQILQWAEGFAEIKKEKTPMLLVLSEADMRL